VFGCPNADDWPNADETAPKAGGRPKAEFCVPPAKEEVGEEVDPNTLGLLAKDAKPLPPLGLGKAPEPPDVANALVVVGDPKADGRAWPKEDCPKTEFGEAPNALVLPKLDVEAPKAEADVVGGLGVLGDAS
jgi:hypothetical protein